MLTMAVQAQSIADSQLDRGDPAMMARPGVRRLIIHADDYGLNRATTEGVLHGFRHGLLTSTAVIANAPHASKALAAWKHLLAEWREGLWPSAALRRTLGEPQLPPDLGVHLNLTQGRPITADRYPGELIDCAGRFPGVWKLFFRLRGATPAVLGAIKRELAGQIELVLDHGIKPTHINGHQYIELMPAVARLLPELLARYGISVVRSAVEPGLWRSTLLAGYGPWTWLLGKVKHYFATKQRRQLQAHGLFFPDVLCGTVHAGRITSAKVVERYLRACADARYAEIVCHPAAAPSESPEAAPDGWHDLLQWQRPKEARLITSADLARCVASSGRKLGRLQQLPLESANAMSLRHEPGC